jgi:hypothetical protein
MPRQAWTVILFVLPQVAGMTGAHYHTQSLVEKRSPVVFARAGLEPDPPDLHLPSS